METTNTNTKQNMETTNVTSQSEGNSIISWGSVAVFAAGLIYIFLLAMGSWTDNRFGTHMVLNTDLSSGPEWFLVYVAVMGSMISFTGLQFFILNATGQMSITEKQDNAMKVGGTLLIGVAAFILALSSISFAAFNWQYFESQLNSKSGIANQAWAWMILTIILTVVVIVFTELLIFTDIIKFERNVYLALRNSSIALVALGWFVFNVCINSFGAMGGDADVLLEGLTGISLTNIGSKLNGAGDVGSALVAASNLTAEQFYKDVLQANVDGLPGWVVASGPFTKFWEEGTSITLKPILPPLLYDTVVSFGGLQNLLLEGGTLLGKIGESPLGDYLQSFAKAGPIMGVNNAFNSYLIFTLLLGFGLIGIPAYGVLTLNSEEKPSIMFWGSISVIIAMFVIYFFLLLTPYMVNMEGANVLGPIGLLLTGNYDPSIAPGLIALPGHDGGIHSAIVYFSPQYEGTAVWWTAEVLTFIVPVAAFVGTWLTIKFTK